MSTINATNIKNAASSVTNIILDTDGGITSAGNVKIGGTSATPTTQINDLGFAFFKNSTGGSYTWINYSGGTGIGLKISDTDDYANAKTQINANGDITASGMVDGLGLKSNSYLLVDSNDTNDSNNLIVANP